MKPRREFFKNLLLTIAFLPPFWKRAQAEGTGTGLSGTWQAGGVTLRIQCTNGRCCVVASGFGQQMSHSGELTCDTSASGDLGSLSVSGDCLTAYHTQSGETVTFYRVS